MVKKRNLKQQSILKLVLSIIIIVLLNVISFFAFTRADLTSEHRYTITPATKEMLRELKDVVTIKVYLDGDMPAGFKRLRNSVHEMLDEFRVYSKDNIDYEFIDPNKSTDEKERGELYRQLAKKGLQPTNLQQKGKDKTSQQIVFPGAILNYAGANVEIPLQLLKSRLGAAPEEMINNSIESLEYELANAIRKVTKGSKQKIGFLQGEKELNTRQLTDLARSLKEVYDVDTVVLRQNLHALEGFRLLVIAKPDTAFDNKDKFIIDQFIMRGGRVLWLIDPMQISMDSLEKTVTNIAVANNLNLEDQLFRYGVRINYDLITDLQAALIPVQTGYTGNQPHYEYVPWYYSPLIYPESVHPIVSNLNAIRCEFVSSIDTVESPGVTKTVLLSTSDHSKILKAPVRVSLNIARDKPVESEFNNKHVPVAVLLEGSFTSAYLHRLSFTPDQAREIGVRDSSLKTKMIVISDGDMMASYVSKSTGNIFPLGYDRFTRETFGNKNFLLNCIDYLCDDSNLLTIRSKELKIRMLDQAKLDEGKLKWQLINVAAPIALVLLFGVLRAFRRKRKYEREG